MDNANLASSQPGNLRAKPTENNGKQVSMDASEITQEQCRETDLCHKASSELDVGDSSTSAIVPVHNTQTACKEGIEESQSDVTLPASKRSRVEDPTSSSRTQDTALQQHLPDRTVNSSKSSTAYASDDTGVLTCSSCSKYPETDSSQRCKENTPPTSSSSSRTLYVEETNTNVEKNRLRHADGVSTGSPTRQYISVQEPAQDKEGFSRHGSPTPRDTQIPQGPRGFWPPFHPSRRINANRDFEEAPRLRAQLRKLQEDLAHERRVNNTMRTDIETAAKAKIEAALEAMLLELLQKQTDVIKRSADLQRKEQELQQREAQIKQLEDFLALGQNALYRKLEKQDVHALAAMQLAEARYEGVAIATGRLQARQLDHARKEEELQARTNALDFRERQYKAIRNAIEVGVCDGPGLQTTSQAVQGKGEQDLVLVEGTKITKGADEALQESYQAAFLDGYVACRQLMMAMEDIRIGKISSGNVDLGFLADPNHPANPLRVGMQLGSRELEKRQEKKQNPSKSMAEPLPQAGLNKTTNGICNGDQPKMDRCNSNILKTSKPSDNHHTRTLLRYEESETDERIPPKKPNIRRPEGTASNHDKQIDLIDLY